MSNPTKKDVLLSLRRGDLDAFNHPDEPWDAAEFRRIVGETAIVDPDDLFGAALKVWMRSDMTMTFVAATQVATWANGGDLGGVATNPDTVNSDPEFVASCPEMKGQPSVSMGIISSALTDYMTFPHDASLLMDTNGLSINVTGLMSPHATTETLISKWNDTAADKSWWLGCASSFGTFGRASTPAGVLEWSAVMLGSAHDGIAKSHRLFSYGSDTIYHQRNSGKLNLDSGSGTYSVGTADVCIGARATATVPADYARFQYGEIAIVSRATTVAEDCMYARYLLDRFGTR